jgi:hypothetical protein
MTPTQKHLWWTDPIFGLENLDWALVFLLLFVFLKVLGLWMEFRWAREDAERRRRKV